MARGVCGGMQSGRDTSVHDDGTNIWQWVNVEAACEERDIFDNVIPGATRTMCTNQTNSNSQ